MRSWVALGVLVAGCGSSPPPPVAPIPAPTDDKVPQLTTMEVAREPAKVAEAEAPLPPARRFPIAWHTARAGKSTPGGRAVAFRPDGSLVVTGQGEAERWAGKPNKKLDRLYPHFVASLGADGKAEWVRTIDVGNGGAEGVASGPDGSVIVTGWFDNKLRIAGKVVATSAGEVDVFVARFERDGKLAWAIRAGGPGLELASGVAVASDGTSYVTGTIGGAAKFGELDAQHIGDRDVFVARFDPQGAVQWISIGGGKDSDSGAAITLTKRAVCVTGEFSGVVKFQSVTLTMPEPEPNKVANPSNVFVVCHGLNGDVLWGERLGTHTSFDRAADIAALSDGSVVVTGEHSKRAFVARFSSGGKKLWERHATGDAVGRGLVALPGDEVLVATYLVSGELELPGRWRKKTVKARGADTVLALYTAEGEILGVGQIAGEKSRTGDERNEHEVDTAQLAASSTGRVALVGRLWGNAVVEAGDLLVPSKDKITGASGMDLVLVVLDALVAVTP